jgi:hypothetical protein
MLENSAATTEDELVGTYKLISTTRIVLETGQAVAEKNSGFVMYGRDGRMMVIILTGERPKPATIDKATDQECIELFRSPVAYGGSYNFDGKTVEHHVDISSNEVWTGTTLIRDVKRDGSRLILTTRPAPSPFDGKLVSATLVWEKVQSKRKVCSGSDSE